MMLHGSIPALVTPFDMDGELDLPALEAFVDWQILQGSAGLVPCGTTGEAATLTEDEKDAVLKTVLSATAGRVPVIMGCGGNATRAVVAAVKRAQSLGADGVMVVAPFYNKPSQDGIFAHFKAVSDVSDVPIVAYNVPGRTVADIATQTMARIADLPGVVALKDASGDLPRVSDLHRALGRDFCQLSGEDSTAVGFNAMGGVGCISVTANVVPKLCADQQAACAAGDYAAARKLQDRLMPLHHAMFAAPSPAPVKYLLARARGMAERLRLPLLPLPPADHARLDKAFDHANISVSDA